MTDTYNPESGQSEICFQGTCQRGSGEDTCLASFYNSKTEQHEWCGCFCHIPPSWNNMSILESRVDMVMCMHQLLTIHAAVVNTFIQLPMGDHWSIKDHLADLLRSFEAIMEHAGVEPPPGGWRSPFLVQIPLGGH